MSGNDTEEKKHAPTSTKLRRARRDGKVPHANDVLALAIWPLLIWLLFTWPSFEGGLRLLMTRVLTLDYNMPTEDVMSDMVMGLFWSGVGIVAPFFVVAIIISFLIGLLDNQGFVFSGKPITPDFNRLNPIEGFKRIFSMRTAVESGYGLAKLAIFAGVAIVHFYVNIDALKQLQACGAACLTTTWSTLINPLLAMYLAIFIIAAIIDFILSRQLFNYEMRMSHTELKRENKDVYGNPDIKTRRRDLGRDIASGPVRMGLGATSMLFIGRDVIVGVRYVANETPAPYIVLKASGDRRREIMRDARRTGVPSVASDTIAKALFNRGIVGNVIPRATFTVVAKELMDKGLA
jgi:type III secretion protein U